MKIFKIKNCKECLHCDTKLTKGYGYATDFFCKLHDNKIIKGYCEWGSEEPQDNEFPIWCTLSDDK